MGEKDVDFEKMKSKPAREIEDWPACCLLLDSETRLAMMAMVMAMMMVAVAVVIVVIIAVLVIIVVTMAATTTRAVDLFQILLVQIEFYVVLRGVFVPETEDTHDCFLLFLCIVFEWISNFYL
jgi:hypothetical protein